MRRTAVMDVALNVLTVLAIVFCWFALNRWVLPKFGVKT
jgi:hypothetical protein